MFDWVLSMPLRFLEEKASVMSSNGMVTTISYVMKKTSENVTYAKWTISKLIFSVIWGLA